MGKWRSYKDLRHFLPTGMPEEPNICAINHYYNKKKAEIQSQLKKDNKAMSSRRMERLGTYRYCHIHDFFHKAAGIIVNYALTHRAGTIVIGHNNGWKQDPSLSKKESQKFVSIPHSQFIEILKDKAGRSGISVQIVEESYTSRASLWYEDRMPVYGNEEASDLQRFSGRRVKRGMYRTKAGIQINADINGAGNIIRKYGKQAFPNKKDYLIKTVLRINVA